MTPTASPDAFIAWNVILTIAVIASVVSNIMQSIRSTRQQKREVTMVDGVVTTESCRMLRNTSDNRIHRLEQDMLALRQDLKVAIDLFHQNGDERARRLHERIDQLPSQIIAMLKNTGALK
jgi:phosphoribosylaminoimidazole-succinocarboxamide synthase